QLKRNAFIVAATALWLSNAGAAEASQLARFVATRGLERIARDAATASGRMRRAAGAPVGRSAAASHPLQGSIEKEGATIASVRARAPGDGRLGAGLDERRDELRKVASAIRDSIVGLEAGGTPTEEERRLAARIPKRGAASLSDWLALERKVADKRADEARRRRDEREAAAAKPARGKAVSPAAAGAGQKKLTPLMQWEAMNWVDGKTDAATIARRVCAEALSAGSWYYGECTPALVEKFFEGQAKDGLITWETGREGTKPSRGSPDEFQLTSSGLRPSNSPGANGPSGRLSSGACDGASRRSAREPRRRLRRPSGGSPRSRCAAGSARRPRPPPPAAGAARERRPWP